MKKPEPVRQDFSLHGKAGESVCMSDKTQASIRDAEIDRLKEYAATCKADEFVWRQRAERYRAVLVRLAKHVGPGWRKVAKEALK